MRHGRDWSQLVLRTFRRYARSARLREKSAGLRSNGGTADRRGKRQRFPFTKPLEFHLGRKFHGYGALDALPAHYRAGTSGGERREGGLILSGSTAVGAT